MVRALEERCVTQPGWIGIGVGATPQASEDTTGTAAGAGAGNGGTPDGAVVVVHRSCFGSSAANNVVSGPVEAQEQFKNMKKEQVCGCMCQMGHGRAAAECVGNSLM